MLICEPLKPFLLSCVTVFLCSAYHNVNVIWLLYLLSIFPFSRPFKSIYTSVSKVTGLHNLCLLSFCHHIPIKPALKHKEHSEVFPCGRSTPLPQYTFMALCLYTGTSLPLPTLSFMLLVVFSITFC